MCFIRVEKQARSIMSENSFVLDIFKLASYQHHEPIHVTHQYTFKNERIIDPRKRRKKLCCLFLYGSRKYRSKKIIFTNTLALQRRLSIIYFGFLRIALLNEESNSTKAKALVYQQNENRNMKRERT